jgi:hypothetical protein
VTAPTNAGSYAVVATITDSNYTGSANDTLRIDTRGVATNDFYTTYVGEALAIGTPGVLTNDNDADGDSLTAVLVSGPGHAASGGFALYSNGSFTYTPDGTYTGTDSFTYKASDGVADSDAATVTVTVLAADARSVAQNDAYVVDAGQVLTGNVLGNDNGNSLTPVLLDVPTHSEPGGFTLYADGSFTYTPAAGFVGTDSFTYVADDGVADSNVALVTVAVVAAGSSPVAINDNYGATAETMLSILGPAGVLANDIGATQAYLVRAPLYGSLTLSTDGSFSYTPDAGFVGVDSFLYVTGDSNVAMVTITVTSP